MMKILGTLAAGIAAVTLTACGTADSSQRTATADYPIYESIDILKAEADIAILATVGDVISREDDDGGSEDAGASVPMVFREAVVTQVIQGDPSLKRIVIAWPDLEKLAIEDRSPLDLGDKVLIFADRVTRTDAPGIETQEEFYVPLGGDNGVLDVIDGELVARTADLDRLKLSEAPTVGDDVPLATTLDAIRSTPALD